MFKTTLTALLLASTAALGAQITAGPSAQDVTFTASSAGLTVTAPPLNLPAFDTTNAGLGAAVITGLNFATGPEVAGFYTASSNSATFQYTAGDGDTLTETIHVTEVQDNTSQPKVYFAGDPPSLLTGDAAFIAAFSGSAAGDWIMNNIGETLSGLVGSARATISTLENTAVTAVPEPVGLAVIGVGFVLLPWLRRQPRDTDGV